MSPMNALPRDHEQVEPGSCPPHPGTWFGRSWWSLRLLRGALLTVLLILALAEPVAASAPPPPPPPASPGSDAICATGRLRIGDIPRLAEPWRITVEADRSLAVEWRPDAVLIATDVSCGFLLDEPRVRTSFYSAAAKGLWDPETAQTQPLDPGDPEPKELPAGTVDFQVIQRALLGLGLTGDDEIGASGLTIRLNTAELPFGPAEIPPETTVVHLTVGDGGATRDVYIDAGTGRTYGYG